MSFNTFLLDIEGTVCPIAFVKDVLFPFFCSRVPTLLASDDDPEVQKLLSQFPQSQQGNLQNYILDLVARDIKDPILKQLQGLVWDKGYRDGEITAPVYTDAVDFIKRGNNIFIYSSGSVKAQKLLFGHVADPDNSGESLDLQPFIKGYFDINTSGKKTDSQSYKSISKEMAIDGPTSKILFISDNILELNAAQDAGLSTALAIRPGNAPVDDKNRYRILEDFSTL